MGSNLVLQPCKQAAWLLALANGRPCPSETISNSRDPIRSPLRHAVAMDGTDRARLLGAVLGKAVAFAPTISMGDLLVLLKPCQLWKRPPWCSRRGINSAV